MQIINISQQRSHLIIRISWRYSSIDTFISISVDCNERNEPNMTQQSSLIGNTKQRENIQMWEKVTKLNKHRGMSAYLIVASIQTFHRVSKNVHAENTSSYTPLNPHISNPSPSTTRHSQRVASTSQYKTVQSNLLDHLACWKALCLNSPLVCYRNTTQTHPSSPLRHVFSI